MFKTKEVTKEVSYLEYKDGAPSFQTWLKETKVVKEAVEEVSHIVKIDGLETKVVEIESQPEVTEPVRPYIPKDVTNLINEYLSKNKNIALQKINITTLPNGLKFYTDNNSLLDLLSADRPAERLGASDEDMTIWKTPDGLKQVRIKDIRDAISLRLSNTASVVGVNQWKIAQT